MKKERIGKASLTEEDIVLEYYVTGCRKTGYGLEVLQRTNDAVTSEICEGISRSKRDIWSLGRAVLQGMVFPGFLSELVEEWK